MQNRLETTARPLGHGLATAIGNEPYEYICNIRTKEPERFSFDPAHQMPELNS
jgi:hypothetical protein